jgi:transposase
MKSRGKAGSAARRARREFSEEFKAEAVRLAAERRAAGGSLTQVGRELDVRPDQLREWTRQQARAHGTGTGLPGETVETVEQENRRLRR